MDELEDREQVPAEAPSKSRIKRELLAVQDLAERLLALPRSRLESLHLSEETWSAIDETSRIKDLRALRRHIKRVAKLLAQEDIEAVRALMDRQSELEGAAAARHHQLERWRERLIAEGDAALSEFLVSCPSADRQQLRQLMRAAQRDQARGRSDAPRKLFRFLRDALEREELDG